MTTRAARALLSEMHPCDARDNAHSTPGGTWHMSTNRMASILDAVERQAIEAAIATTPEPEDDHHHPETTCPICRYAQDHLASTPEPAPVAECPHCDVRHEWPCPTIPRCDEPGCGQEATCGWPTRPGGTGPNGGYRRTCGPHMRALAAASPSPETE